MVAACLWVETAKIVPAAWKVYSWASNRALCGLTSSPFLTQLICPRSQFRRGPTAVSTIPDPNVSYKGGGINALAHTCAAYVAFGPAEVMKSS